MHPASGPSDYRAPEKGEGVINQVADTAGWLSETARDLGKHSLDLAGDLGAAIKERPYTTIGIAAGLAFAVGALWIVGRQRPASRLDALRARLPELPSRDGFLPRGWR